MQALVLHGIGDLRCEQVPMPDVPPGYALDSRRVLRRVRVGYPRVFVKGTYHFPTICGHEFAGTIERIVAPSEDATATGGFAPGDRVAVSAALVRANVPRVRAGNMLQCSTMTI